MKQAYTVLISFMALSGPLSAQYLANNLIAANPLLIKHTHRTTEWQKDADLVTGHIPGAKLVRMQKVTETIVSYFQDSCINEGELSPSWHGEYFSDSHGGGKDMKFSIDCNFNDQKADLTILANNIRSLLMDPLVVNNQEFITMRPSAGKDKDHPYFEFKGDAGEAQDLSMLHYRVWVVAVANQLPYVPVSRAEYLKMACLELGAIKNAMVAEMKKNLPLRDAAVQATDKKAALDQLTTLYSGMDLQIRTRMFLGSYKTDEEYQKESIDKATADLDNTLHLMDHLLSHLSAADLAKPAIVSVKAANFEGFEDGREGGRMLVRVNPAYNATSESSPNAPRCLLVRWQYDPSEPMAAGIDKQIEERFDGQKLMAMLGK